MTLDQERPDDVPLNEAAAWYLRLEANGTDPGTREAFRLWMEADPHNRMAFERLHASTNAVLSVANSGEISALRRASLERVRVAGQRPMAVFGRHRMAFAGALFVCLLTTALLLPARVDTSVQLIQTSSNERKVVVLAEGSRISLDSSSRVRVRLTATARTIELDAGQARFQVAHDSNRPFTVSTEGRTVLATGTDFNVERLPSQSIVTLIDGSVVVSTPTSSRSFARIWGSRNPAPIELRPGEQLDGYADGPTVIRQHIVVSDALAWQRGKITFDDDLLSTAVERMNRYRKRRIEIADPAIGKLRVSGVFDAADTEGFIEAATGFFSLHRTTLPDGSIILTR